MPVPHSPKLAGCWANRITHTGIRRKAQSPLEIRRSSADPTDVDEALLTFGFAEENFDANPRKPSGTDPWAPSH
jgi:hypothetical protein